MAEIRKTRMARRLTRRGATAQPECWGAETTDGIWDFHREDSPGTPWLIYHRPSVADGSLPVPVRFCGTLDECRQVAASPAIAGELAQRKAEWGAELAAVMARACR